ncbi:MAG: hypothetical protein K0S27_163 [Gammaproteobacteria bacterium]|jgi:hypothetical protein|nr:hypothetical protein [Gammaproteobacteria bacterium]
MRNTLIIGLGLAISLGSAAFADELITLNPIDITTGEIGYLKLLNNDGRALSKKITYQLDCDLVADGDKMSFELKQYYNNCGQINLTYKNTSRGGQDGFLNGIFYTKEAHLTIHHVVYNGYTTIGPADSISIENKGNNDSYGTLHVKNCQLTVEAASS